MNLLPSAMTRRKQNAPKRVKSTDKTGSSLANHQSAGANHVTSDIDAGEGDEEEEEGDSASDEESTTDKQTHPTSIDQDQNTERSASEQVSDPPQLKSVTKTLNHKEQKSSEDSCRTKRGRFECDKSSREISAKDQEFVKSVPRATIVASNTSHLEEDAVPWHSQSLAASSSLGCSKYPYSGKLASPRISPSAVLSVTSLDPQMALVMSSMPLSLFPRGRNSPDEQKPVIAYVSEPSSVREDEQPLDLSNKSDRPGPNPSPKDKAAGLKKHISGSACGSITPSSNGFSSLQSLQQRFGCDRPLELIPLQPSVMPRSAVAPQALSVSADSGVRAGSGKPKPGTRSDLMDKQEIPRASASSPVSRSGSSRHTSPMLADEPTTESGSKHTIHRCSCQKSFSTLYALSVHLQETGHTPGSTKTASPMDYPKLVRGQDMWLNQESEQTRRILRCMQCGESFKSLPMLTVHMMQTQHYTKIVSSDHGRRSHKCSTYCDRELDKECIFKCKVCHEAFPDMEGLANHMLVSGHHKKQSSRHIPNSTAFPADASTISRQGRRKRFLPEDITSGVISGTSPSTVASLLEYRHKQAVHSLGAVNGFHTDSKGSSDRPPDAKSVRLVQCDSCGKHVEAHSLDSHVRTCLRQRAEVIDALKNKLAVEEALLSRSQSKLLRSGFSLSSVPGYREVMLAELGSRVRHSEEHEYEKHSREECTHHPRQVKPERDSPETSVTAARHTVTTGRETSAKICDLIEVPLKKWYCSTGENRQALRKEDVGNSDTRNDTSVKSHPMPRVDTDIKAHTLKDKNQEAFQEVTSSSSPGVGQKRKLSEPDLARETFACLRKKDKLSPDLIQDSTGDSLDFTSSALQKLDMFSRGLKLSPPRKSSSPESSLTSQHSLKLSKKRDPSSLLTKPAMTSPKSQLTEGSPDPPKQDVTFDIIDPNAETEETESSASALVAMESFIQKSFSSKSDICSSNLASMFSPFRSCFPLPGQLPDSSDRALSHFARFSKFFRMVPGAPSFPDTTAVDSSRSSQTSVPESQHELSHDKNIHNKKVQLKPHNLSSSIRVPVVKFQHESSPGVCNSENQKVLSERKSDSSFHSFKKSNAANQIDYVSSPLKKYLRYHGSSRISGNTSFDDDIHNHSIDNSSQSPSQFETSAEETLWRRRSPLSREQRDKDSPRNHEDINYDDKDTDNDRKDALENSIEIKQETRWSTDEDDKYGENDKLCAGERNCEESRNLIQNPETQDDATTAAVSGVKATCTDSIQHGSSVAKFDMSERQHSVSIKNETKEDTSEASPDKDDDVSSGNIWGDTADKILPEREMGTDRLKQHGKTDYHPDHCTSYLSDKKKSSPESAMSESQDSICHSSNDHDRNNDDHDRNNAVDNGCGVGLGSVFGKRKMKTVVKTGVGESKMSRIDDLADKILHEAGHMPLEASTHSVNTRETDNTVNDIVCHSDRRFLLRDEDRLHSGSDSKENVTSPISQTDGTECASAVGCWQSDKLGPEPPCCTDMTQPCKVLNSPVSMIQSLSVVGTGLHRLRIASCESTDGLPKSPVSGRALATCVRETENKTSYSRCSSRNSEESQCSIRNSEDSQGLSRNSENSQQSSRNSVDSQRLCRNSEGSQGPSRNSEDCQQHGKNSEDSQCPSRNSEDSQYPNKNSEDSQRPSRNSEDSQRLSRNSENCQRTFRNSEDSQRPSMNSEDNQCPRRNSENTNKQKKSALDSLSSFVYSQPLTSEHPLDCLHRLLSTNDLSHLPADLHNYQAATSNKCLTPDLSVPLNLTSKGEGFVSSGGCSSDENDDNGDPALTEGSTAEGELREYRCAACNRRFASKGSYRYHLSRCHLSSVKKYGIKEAFNMSPYVYLPLDHTAKFSKYYQMAHELANKGK